MREPAGESTPTGTNGTRLTFLVTDECWRLTRWLRLLGYDTASRTARPLSALYRHAYNEGRIVVTRNRSVRASCLFPVVQLTSEALEPQVSQLMREVRLTIDQEQAFTRCDQCNVGLSSIEKSRVTDRVPPYVFRTQQQFFTCPACHRIYWAATHWQRACQVFARLRTEGRDA